MMFGLIPYRYLWWTLNSPWLIYIIPGVELRLFTFIMESDIGFIYRFSNLADKTLKRSVILLKSWFYKMPTTYINYLYKNIALLRS